MKIAIISDIHGNLIALERVLKDIKEKGIEQIYCLGDLVDYAPWDNEVIACIRDENIPCIMGNHDERIAFNQAVTSFDYLTQEENNWRAQAVAYAKRTITDDNKRWLSELPFHFELTYRLSGVYRRVLLLHATPDSNKAYIYEKDYKSDLIAYLDERGADAIVMGHTHLPYVQQVSGKLIVNSGAVGRSREEDRTASYVILEISDTGILAEIRRLNYPIEKVVEAIYNSEIPDYYADFLLGKYRGVR